MLLNPTSLIVLLIAMVHSVHVITSAKVEVPKKKKSENETASNPSCQYTDFHLKAEVARYFQVEKKLDIVAICMLCIGHVGQVCVSLNTQFIYSSRVTLRISFIASALNAPILCLFT